MEWATWLLNAGVAAAAVAVVVLLLRSRAGTEALRGAVSVVSGWSRRRTVVVVLALTAGTRLALLPTFEPVDAADIREYVAKAEAIAEDGHPRRQEVRADGTVFHRTLGWSLPLAGWYRATGTRGVRSAQAFGVLVACGTAALVLALGRTIGRETEGRLAALGYAVLVPHVLFALLPYGETWTTVLVVGAAILHERLRRGGGSLAADAGLGVALGVLLGLVGITRTELLWIPVLCAALLVAERRMRAALPAVLVLAGACVPFAVNHWMRDGYPGHLRTSVQGGLILYFGNNPIAVNGTGNATPEVAAHVQSLYAEDRTGALARDEALLWMRENPEQVLLNAPKKAFHLWLAEPQGFGWLVQEGAPSGMPRTLARPLRWLGHVQSLALLALGIAGWRRLGPERRPWAWILVLHLALWCVLAASPRNRYPLEPFLLLAAAAWMVARTGAGSPGSVAKAASGAPGAGRLAAP